MNQIGKLGEELVEKWLESQGLVILHHRWRCSWGEIDSIAYDGRQPTLVFLEVKTRGYKNWDEDGLLAINQKKQINLSRTAQLFLSNNPELINLPCRFDVALVKYSLSKQNTDFASQKIDLGKPFFWQGYQFILQTYIESAFDLI